MSIWLTHEQSGGELTCLYGGMYEQGHEHLLLVTAALAKPAGANFSIGSSATAGLDARGRADNFISYAKKGLLLPFAQIPWAKGGPVSWSWPGRFGVECPFRCASVPQSILKPLCAKADAGVPCPSAVACVRNSESSEEF